MLKFLQITHTTKLLLFKCLMLFLFWVCSSPLITAQASSFEDLKKITNQITELNNYFSKASEKDPKNKGADKLRKTTSNLVESLNGFQGDAITKDSLTSILNKALQECKKYRSPNAQKLESELKELQTLLPQIAQIKTEEDATPRTRRKKLNKEDVLKRDASNEEASQPKITFSEEEKNEEPVSRAKVVNKKAENTEETNVSGNEAVVASSNSSGSYPTNPMVYVLFAVLIVVMVFFGYFLYNTQIRQIQMLADQIKFMEDELKAIREKDTTVQGMDGATFMAIAEVKKRLESLERNTVDFLQMTEERISKMETRADALAGLAPIEAAVLQADHKKMNAIEEKISAMERKISPESDISPKAIKIARKYDVQVVDHLIEAIHTLSTHSDIGLLKTVCGDVSILLKLSVAKRSWEDIDPYAMATLVQLAYVSAVNEQQDDTYQYLVHNTQQIGFGIHEKVIGKPAFGLDLAENIPYENYLSNPKVKNEEYPNFRAINQQIERKFNLAETQNGTILSILQPTITLQMDGNTQVVLQKGKYVIKT